MTRLVPHPLLTATLILMWLMLNRFSLGHLLLGTAIALVAGQAMAKLEPERARLRRPDLIARLFLRVTADIVRSNLAVARQVIVDPPGRSPGFVEIDLEVRSPLALATLAVIITSTPGTAWVDYDAARGRLLMHVLDMTDEEEWRRVVNDRYGSLMKEIFA